jgi:hypothetical protein
VKKRDPLATTPGRGQAAARSLDVDTPRRPEEGGDRGEALDMDDAELVGMLRLPPKSVPQLRTRESFRAFFRNMDPLRMERLLQTAYQDLGADERFDKMTRRMEVLRGALKPVS